MRIVSLARVVAFFVSVVAVAAAVPDACAQGILIPLTTRRDMVFDHSGKYLFITTSDGWVRPYNLSNGQLETGYNLGGILFGIDIAFDDTYLLIAQAAAAAQDSPAKVYKLDLRSGAVTEITIPTPPDSGKYYGTADVAIMSSGIAIVSSQVTGYLHQIDLATNAVTERWDVPPGFFGAAVQGGAALNRSEDGTRLSISEYNGTTGCLTFSAVTNTFGIRGTASSRRVAVSRNGAQIATAHQLSPSVSLDTPDYALIHTFGHLGSGVAFDAVSDTLYAASTFSNEIIAYNSKTFAEKLRLPVGEILMSSNIDGILVSSHDGRHLALQTDAGVRVFAVPNEDRPAPPPTFGIPIDMVFDHAGKYLYITTLLDWVWPYNLTTRSLEAPYYLGGSLNGVDITPDDSYLLVAQYFRGALQGTVQKVNLVTREVTNIDYVMDFHNVGGAWDIGIGSNGKALVTSHIGNFSGTCDLHQIDLSTSTVSTRADVPDVFGKIQQETQIHRSADRNQFVLLGANSSSGPMFTYSAVTDSFGPMYGGGSFLEYASGAVNRNGSLLGLRLAGDNASLRTLSFSTLHSFNDLRSGVAFDAVRDIFYGVNTTTNEIIAYDTNSYAELFRLNIGESIPSASVQFDAGSLVASQDGNYLALITPSTLRIFDTQTKTVTALPTPTATPGPAGQLANISTRAFVNNGDNVTIAGFILRGQFPEKIFLRAIGPSLTAAGVPGAMEDPTLELYNSTGALIGTNDNWKDSPDQAQIVSAGLSPTDNREACIVATLDPGAYTAVLRGKSQTTGNALVELYDGGPKYLGTRQMLGNISTRGLAGVNDSVMIAGFITNGGTTRILVRGIGPSLAAFNVPNPVQDPMIELHDSNGALITSNDNWQETHAAEIWNTGIAPINDLESAVISSLPSGSYTAILRGKDNSTGNGLVEVYSLQ